MVGGVQHDEAFKWVASGVLLVWALSAHYPIIGLASVALAALDLQVMLLWTCFVGSLVGAILTIVSGLAVLLPLQFFPASKVNDKRANKLRLIAIGVLWVRCPGYLFVDVCCASMPRYSCMYTLLDTILT